MPEPTMERPPERERRTRRPRSGVHGVRMECETAILLRISPVTNSSCMVNWLTASRGRLSTLVKGCYRRKSLFLGQLDVFRTCELIYYAPLRIENAGIARDVSVLAARNRIRTLWRSSAVASYLCDLAGHLSPEPVTGAAFECLNLALDALDAGRAPGSILLWFELQMADHMGWRPRLESCAVCAQPAEANTPVLFSPGLGGLVCSACQSLRSSDGIKISARLLAQIRERQQARHPDHLSEIRLPIRDIQLLERAFGNFLQHHLELNPVARALAFEGLRTPMPT